MIVEFYKKIGETPLQSIERFKKENPEHDKSKISYAGRLDPMAHGVLVLLINESCKFQNTLHRVSKVYRFKILFGVSTDTYDILGMFTGLSSPPNFSNDEVKQKLNILRDTDYYQKYPPYSSYRINGKPLWEWAKLGKLEDVYNLVESKKVNIYNYEIIKKELLKGKEIYKIVKGNINKLREREFNSFRAESILQEWKQNYEENNREYPVFEIEIDVSSGTYIRSICFEIGIMLKSRAIAFDIERINVNINK